MFLPRFISELKRVVDTRSVDELYAEVYKTLVDARFLDDDAWGAPPTVEALVASTGDRAAT